LRLTLKSQGPVESPGWHVRPIWVGDPKESRGLALVLQLWFVSVRTQPRGAAVQQLSLSGPGRNSRLSRPRECRWN